MVIIDLFYSDYELGKSFLHSHTHSGNVLAASVAVEVLNIFAEENICKKAEESYDNFAPQTQIIHSSQLCGCGVCQNRVCVVLIFIIQQR